MTKCETQFYPQFCASSFCTFYDGGVLILLEVVSTAVMRSDFDARGGVQTVPSEDAKSANRGTAEASSFEEGYR